MTRADLPGERLASEILDGLELTIDRARQLIRTMKPVARRKRGRAGSDELVTNVDLAVEELLVERLHGLAPGAAIVSEESYSDASCLTADLCLVVDPIDGTKELVSGSPHFGISVAVLINGRPVAALLDFPLRSLRIRSGLGGSILVDGNVLSAFPVQRAASDRGRPIAVSSGQLGELRACQPLLAIGRPEPIGAFTPKIAAVLLDQSSVAVRLPQGDDELRIWDYVGAGHLLRQRGMVLLSFDGSLLMDHMPQAHRNGWVAGPLQLCEEIVRVFRDESAYSRTWGAVE